MRDRVTAALIIVVPLLILWEDVAQGHLLGLYLGAFVCLALSFAGGESSGPIQINQYLTFFLLYVAAWFAFWLSLHYAGRIIIDVILLGIDAILILMIGVIIYGAVAASKRPLDFWFNFICVSILVQASLAICQHHFFNPVESVLSLVTTVCYSSWGNAHSPAGSLANTNYLGAFLAIGLPFFFRRKWIYAFPVAAYALYLTHCRTAEIAVLIVGFVYVCKHGVPFIDFFLGKKLGNFICTLIILGLISGIYLMVAINPGSFVERYEDFWIGPIKIWLGSWHTFLFGVGPGITSRINNFLHNEYIPLLFNYGIIGFGIVGGYIIATLRHKGKINIILTCALWIILIDMLGNHLLHIPATALLVIFVLGLIDREKMQNGNISFGNN